MISFIICAASPALLENLRKNIHETTGVEFELIIVENYDNRYNIFQAYNIGVKRSQYSILCFLHEDVLFVTPGWGNRLIDHLNDPEVGMIGIAGTNCLLDIPGGWWTSYKIALNFIQVMNDGVETVKSKKISGTVNDEVVCVDGAAFFIKKPLFQSISFDETLFNGFHFYDLDISLQVKALGYKIFVVHDILLKHYSEGKLNVTWIKESIRFQEKWKRNLPLYVPGALQDKDLDGLRSIALLDFLTLN